MNKKCISSPYCSHNTNGRDLNKPCSIEFIEQKKEKKPFYYNERAIVAAAIGVAILPDRTVFISPTAI